MTQCRQALIIGAPDPTNHDQSIILVDSSNFFTTMDRGVVVSKIKLTRTNPVTKEN